MAGVDSKLRRGRKAADGRGTIAPYRTKTWQGWRGRVMVGYLGNGRPDVRAGYAGTEKA